MRLKQFFILLLGCLMMNDLAAQQILHTQVLVVAGSTGGTAAGIQAARMGVKTIIVEETTMLGGMLTAAAVSCTDGNANLPSGMWNEFRQALLTHYKRKFLNTGWVSETCFEPSVGDSIFKAWAGKEHQLTVFYQWRFSKAIKKGNKVVGVEFVNNEKKRFIVYANVVVDATDLGDVFANAGAAYDLGTDDPAVTGEQEAVKKTNIIQDITWAAVLKDYGFGIDKTIPKPIGYNPERYYCSNTDAPCNGQPWNGDKWKMLNYGKLPKNMVTGAQKYMLNWPPHGNDFYLDVVDADFSTRENRYELAKQQTLGFIYFMQTELGMKHISLAEDELDGGMALVPYNREGRRVKGIVQFNINHIQHPYNYTLYRTGIAVGDYPVDHHHAQYPGNVPEIQFPHIPSFNIPLGALIPEKLEGLIVCDKGISVTNIVNGTTRLQPVVFLTGQAAGVLAAKTVQQKKEPRKIHVRSVQLSLLKAKCYILPFVDVKPVDPNWEAIQRIGATGILKGFGKAEGWSNKTFFYPDSTMNQFEFVYGLNEFFFNGITNNYSKDSLVTYQFIAEILQRFFQQNLRRTMLQFFPPLIGDDQQHRYPELKSEIEANRPLRRRAIARILDTSTDFFLREILNDGKFQNNYFLRVK